MNIKGQLDNLAADLCGSFDVHYLEDGSAMLQTPFYFDDGDGLPLFVERLDDGLWRITDRGGTVSHFYWDDFVVSDARRDQIADIATGNELVLTDRFELRLDLSERPDAYAVAQFLRGTSQVSALTHLVQARSQQYPRLIADRVASLVPDEAITRRWAHPADRNEIYRPDLHLEARTGQVLLFAVSSGEKATRTALSTSKLRGWGDRSHFLVPYDEGRLRRDDFHRLEENLPEPATLIPVPADSTGLLREMLSDLGVPLRTAA